MPVEAVDATVRALLPADLADGSHVLGRRVVSDDSHPESGLLPFAIGHDDAAAPTVAQTDTRPVNLVYGVLTALGYLGLFTLVGLTVFDLFVTCATAAGRRLPRIAALVAVLAYAALVPVTVVRERGAGPGELLDPTTIASGWSEAAAVTLAIAGSGVALMLYRTSRWKPGTGMAS